MQKKMGERTATIEGLFEEAFRKIAPKTKSRESEMIYYALKKLEGINRSDNTSQHTPKYWSKMFGNQVHKSS
jgi:hypothetical protein